MSTPNVDAVPDAGGGDVAGDTGGGSADGGSAGDGNPTLAEMEAIMAAEGRVDDAAGFEQTPEPPTKPGDLVPSKLTATPPKKPDPETEKSADKPDAEPPVAAKPDDKPATDDKKPDDAPPADLTARETALTKEAARLRQGHVKLAREREAVVAKMNEANAAIERAKAFEERARAYDSLPTQFAADPLGFIYKLAGKNTPAEQEEFMTAFLDKVVETEKPPAEREILKLRAELAAKDAAALKERQEAEAKAARDREVQTLAEWQRGNVEAARKDPEKYDLINSLGQEAAVHETCVAYFNQHKVILDPLVAADYVEKGLREGLAKSKYVKGLGQSAPAAAPAKPAAAQSAPSSKATSAPKQSGPTTLAGVASGEGAPSERELPEDDDARMAAVFREMQTGNELPDHFRI